MTKLEQLTVAAPLMTIARLRAWRRVLDAVAEMREALEHRIWREDPEDVLLEADCQTWRKLAWALGDFLKARRAS